MKTEKLKQNVKGYVHQFEDGGLRLLRKGQKGVIHAIFSRFGLVLILLLLQVGLLFSIFRWFGNLWPHYFGGSVVVTSAMVIYLLNSKMDNSAKITWMVVVAIAPVVGIPMFFYVKSNFGHNILRKRLLELEAPLSITTGFDRDNLYLEVCHPSVKRVELLARVRAALRVNRYGGGSLPGGVFSAQGLTINYERRKVFVDGQEVRLTQTEYNIVAFLSEHAGRVMTYAAIVRAIWGDTDASSTKKLQVNMANIRKKLGSRPGSNTYILNELGVGYRMIEEDAKPLEPAEETK